MRQNSKIVARDGWRHITLIAFLLVCAILLVSHNAFASAPTLQWSFPARIPGYLTQTQPPIMVVDQNRTVHAFHSQVVKGESAIFYSQWSQQQGWTTPVDVILSPRPNAAIVKGAFLDGKGTVHLIFFGGNDLGSDVYYSRAPLTLASHADAWTTPKKIGPASNFILAMLAGDDKGNLFVYYGGSQLGNGLYEVYSRDSGDSWSKPDPVFLTNDPDTYPGTGTLLMGSDGHLHVVWSVWRPPVGGEILYYARLDTKNNEMTVPLALSRPVDGTQLGPDFPALLSYHSTLILIFHETFENGNFGKVMRLSHDNGRTWGEKTWAFPPLVGGNGAANLLLDSNDVVHAVLANRITDESHGMWDSVWEGDHWSEVQPIKVGPKTRVFDPSIVQAVVVQGNVLFATWISEGAFDGVWYSYAKVDAPELPVHEVPTPQPSPTPLQTPTAVATSTRMPDATPVPPQFLSTDDPGLTNVSPAAALVIAVPAVLALISLVGLRRVWSIKGGH